MARPIATSPGFGADARVWVGEQLHRLQLRLVGDAGEPRVRPWSTVVRLPTDHGAVWFKANHAYTTYEPALLARLAEAAPRLVHRPLAVDTDRAWSLSGDGGSMLRALPDDDVLDRWERILPAYATMQRDLAAAANNLIALGVPDERPSRMPAVLGWLLEQTDRLLVDEPDGLTSDQLRRLRQLQRAFTDRCTYLDGSEIAPSIEHGDLHDGNVFVRAARSAIFDWGDASIAHPFGSLLVTLRTIALRYRLDADTAQLARLRDAYLEPWTTEHTRAHLIITARVAMDVAKVNRASSWERALAGVPPGVRGEYRDAVSGWLAELLNEPDQPSP